MTSRSSRSPIRRRPRVRMALILTAVSLATLMALAPGVMAGGGTVVVTTIPGGGWIRSLETTAGGSASLVAGPGPGTLGTGSLALTIASNTDLAGVDRAYPAGPAFSDLTAASWRTFVTGAGIPAEGAALKFVGYQDGVLPLDDFTTLVVERVYNGTVTPNVWQDNALSDTTMVWQTTDSGDGFCLNEVSSPVCTFAAFKAAYPTARFFGVQVAIGTGVPAVTSWADGVSLTIDDVVETWDFEPAAAPAASIPASIPSTSMAAPSAPSGSVAVIVFGSIALLSALSMAIVQRRRLSR